MAWGDRVAEARIGDPVRAQGADRNIAALQLVRALGAGLDPGEAVADGVVYRLVVAGLEMEEPVVALAAPVAAVKGVVAPEVEGAADQPPVLLGDDQNDPGP